MNPREQGRSVSPATMESHLWSIVLAGGEGERTREFIRTRFGVDKPKQYCTFVGRRSLLQHTVDRVDRIVSPFRRVIVAARHHRIELRRQMTRRADGTMLFQPRNLGTAAGVFLPLARVLAKDPHATVAIFPSDHFIFPEGRFIETVEKALEVSRCLLGKPVLIGVEPDNPETEYGWIEPGNLVRSTAVSRAWSITRFREKPSQETAARIASRGALWNTAILVAKADVLWRLGWHHLPELMPPFVELRRVFANQAPGLETELEPMYSRLATRDFSRHLLQRAASELAVVKLDRCSWSDWGSPSRILDTLAWIGRPKAPAFQAATLASVQPAGP